jgi:hypothetical protein
MNEILAQVVQAVIGVVASIVAILLVTYLKKGFLILLDTIPSSYAPLAKRLVKKYMQRAYKDLTGQQKMDKALQRIKQQYKWFPASVIKTEIQKQYDLFMIEHEGKK